MTSEYAQMQAAVEAETEKRKAATLKVVAAANEKMLLDEYRAAGVDPVPSDDGSIVSLPMLRSLGWTISEIGGERVLVAPKGSA